MQIVNKLNDSFDHKYSLNFFSVARAKTFAYLHLHLHSCLFPQGTIKFHRIKLRRNFLLKSKFIEKCQNKQNGGRTSEYLNLLTVLSTNDL